MRLACTSALCARHESGIWMTAASEDIMLEGSAFVHLMQLLREALAEISRAAMETGGATSNKSGLRK